MKSPGVTLRRPMLASRTATATCSDLDPSGGSGHLLGRALGTSVVLEREHRRDALGCVAGRHDLDPHVGHELGRLLAARRTFGLLGSTITSDAPVARMALASSPADGLALWPPRRPNARRASGRSAPARRHWATAMTADRRVRSRVARVDGGDARSRPASLTRSRDAALACRSRFSTAIRLSRRATGRSR